MKYRELKRLFAKHGVTYVRTRGDHEVWTVGSCTTVVRRTARLRPALCARSKSTWPRVSEKDGSANEDLQH